MLLSQLEEGNFMDRGGEFQLELSLSAVRSLYEHRDTLNRHWELVQCNNTQAKRVHIVFYDRV